MSHAIRIITSVKSPNGLPYEVNLGKNTILIGSNEAGKSAIAESLQLARTGSAYGLLYRDKPIKDGTLLSALMPKETDICVANAFLDTGENSVWELERGKLPTQTGPKGTTLSVAELHGVMAGNSETQGKFFWKQLCTQVSLGDLLAIIDDGLHDSLILVCPVMDANIDLVDAITRLGKIQRNQASIAKAGQIALESLGSFQATSDAEMVEVGKGLSRAHLRDILQVIYVDYREDPTLQASHVLRHLVRMLGGQDAISRIPPTEDVQGEYAEVLLSKRLSRAASAARGGEKRARDLQVSLKKLKEGLLEVLFSMVEAAAKNFSDTVSSFLPEGEEFIFEVHGRALLIGLRRNNEDHIALSGSTEARVLAAVSAALGDENDLIIVDDRMWDSATLAKTMKVLEKAESQIILMTTVKPKGKRRSGWKYVEISRSLGEPLEISD